MNAPLYGSTRGFLCRWLVIGIVLLALQGQAPAQQPTTEYYHDFRGKPLPAEFVPFNADNGKFLRFEPEGMRITLPEDYQHPAHGVGVQTTFGLQGDFEVTTTLRLLQLDLPVRGLGSGPGLTIHTESAEAKIRRVVRGGGKHWVLWSLKAPEFKIPWASNVSACDETLVRLRLKRTGATLHFLWAAGDGEVFTQINQTDFTRDEIKVVRLVAANDNNSCKQDVRFIDLRIRSGELSKVPLNATPAELSGKDRDFSWLLLALGGLMVVLLSVGVWVAVRQSRRNGNDLDEILGAEPAQTGAAPMALSFPCSGCGKTLKVKADLAGKKVKCPQCDQTIHVPVNKEVESNPS